jgi:hypothetical protein
MDEISSISAIDQKMAEMRIKNLELLKRHQEIEEDRQLAQQSGATVESTKASTMRGTSKNRGRNTGNHQNYQENQHEQMHRPPARRKFENDRNDTQPQRAQRVDYNRLKHERAHEIANQQYNNNIISPELLEYAYPFHYQSENNHDADEPAHAKKLVIVNHQATRIGSGRFNQQQQGQRRREERMRRSGTNHNGHPGGPSEFHLDVPQIPIWHNGSIQPPIHVQLLPSNINGHHTGVDHLMNNGSDQLDQPNYIHNFIYPTSAQTTAYNGNGTVYFAHPPPPMSNGPPPSSQPTPAHFHQYHPTRTFENSNRHQFHHPSHFQSSPVFQPPPPPPPSAQLSTSNVHQQQEDSSVDLPSRFRHLAKPDHENKYPQQRPMSGDFERLHNSSSRFNHEHRFQARPQSFYDFSSHQQSKTNFFRSSNNNNNRYQRNNNNNTNNTLPLSAYMNTDDSSYQNENIHNNNYWGTSYQRRRTNQQRTHHQDKHQFPLSSYDPRQYGFNNNYQRRNDFTNRTNSNRRNTNNNRIDQSNDIDLIEEWWEDDNTELIGTNQSTVNNDSQITTTTVDDSGNSSLSTSMHLKESTLDDEDNNISANDFISPPSDISTTDSNIIESLDQLQQQLKLEEDLEKEFESENDLLLLSKEPTTYDTAHFMQWAKEKFREELAGRLTAQEIEQHDAVATDDDDDDDDDDLLVNTDVHLEKFSIDQTTDEDNIEHIDELKDDLNEKLKLEETTVIE